MCLYHDSDERLYYHVSGARCAGATYQNTLIRELGCRGSHEVLLSKHPTLKATTMPASPPGRINYIHCHEYYSKSGLLAPTSCLQLVAGEKAL